MSKTLNSDSAEMPKLTLAQLDQAVTGELVVVWQGQPLPYRLRRDELEVFRQAQDDGFVVVRRRRVNLSFAYSAWCDLHNVPSLKLEVRRVYAAVQLHMITTAPRRLSVLEQEGIGAQFKRFMSSDSWFTLGEMYAYCSKVHLDKARVLARSLVLMLQRSRPAPIDLKALDGDILERAIAVGYLTGCADDAQQQAWRDWCHQHRRPTVTLIPVALPEHQGQYTLELLPTQYANTRFQQFTVEDIRRILLNVSRSTPGHLKSLLEGSRTQTASQHSYLNSAGVRIGPLPIKAACRLASSTLASLGFLPGQDVEVVAPSSEVNGESLSLFQVK